MHPSKRKTGRDQPTPSSGIWGSSSAFHGKQVASLQIQKCYPGPASVRMPAMVYVQED